MSLTNSTYLKIMIKFILISRDYLLKQNVDIINDGANNFPSQCNDLLTDYVEIKTSLGLKIEDAVDITQHFCNWLHEKGYTPVILTAFSNEE